MGYLKSFDFSSPVRIVFGEGVFSKAGQLASELGQHALIVTGSGSVDVAPLKAQFIRAGVATSFFLVAHEPDIDTIQAGLETTRSSGCDMVVCLGGGSVIDAGKAIAAMMTNAGDVVDYLEVVGNGRTVDLPGLPMIAISTTAGTGSEVTKNAVISHYGKAVKVSMRGNGMNARIALIDPRLTYSMTKELTASTGMDALTQVIEAYLSRNANAITDVIALEGIKRGATHLYRAYLNGGDGEARENMCMTSLLSGIALANAGLGAVHGFAGVVGGMANVAHGAICACFLPKVLKTNLAALERGANNYDVIDKFSTLSRIVTGDDEAKPSAVVEWSHCLSEKMQVKNLRELGIMPSDFPEIIEKVKLSSSMQKNPIVLSEGELLDILQESF